MQRTRPLCKTNLEDNLLPINRPSRRRETRKGELAWKNKDQNPSGSSDRLPSGGPEAGAEPRARPLEARPDSATPRTTAPGRLGRAPHPHAHAATRSYTLTHAPPRVVTPGQGLGGCRAEKGGADVPASRRRGRGGSPPCSRARETPAPTPRYLNHGDPTRPAADGRKRTVPGNHVGSQRWQRLLLPGPGGCLLLTRGPSGRGPKPAVATAHHWPNGTLLTSPGRSSSCSPSIGRSASAPPPRPPLSRTAIGFA